MKLSSSGPKRPRLATLGLLLRTTAAYELWQVRWWPAVEAKWWQGQDARLYETVSHSCRAVSLRRCSTLWSKRGGGCPAQLLCNLVQPCVGATRCGFQAQLTKSPSMADSTHTKLWLQVITDGCRDVCLYAAACRQEYRSTSAGLRQNQDTSAPRTQTA